MAIKPNLSYQIEIPLKDEKNENCCALTYFEIGPMREDMRLKLSNKILMQIIDEPFFNDLRTQQQLGYVVFSRDFQTRDILGNQLLVQSSLKSCEYLVSCINKFLIDIREKFKNLTDEEFETAKKSVHTVLAEKDINLGKDKIRMWRELFSHKYDFHRQEHDLQVLATITKKDVQDLFERTFFSENTKRIDFELTSKHHAACHTEWEEKNKEDPIFKTMNRVKVTQTYQEFKAACEVHPNVYKENYIARYQQ